MVELDNISEIVGQELCNGCGTCYSICPNNAISLDINDTLGIIYSTIERSKCIDCKKCLEVCPSMDILKYNGIDNSNCIGEYLNLYYGYALKSELRYHASSGGIVSALIKYLMDEKLIDGFTIVKPSEESPFIYEPSISNSIDDITKYAGTRYFPIPINKILRDLNERDGKYAIIGTPCVINGILKYEKLFPAIKKKIFIKIGFFCLGAPNMNSYKYYMKVNKIPNSNLKSIYRGEGWPGNNVFEYKDGRKIKVSRRPKKLTKILHHTISFYPIFAQKRCILCQDRFSNSSDLSVGDAWLDEFKNDKLGTSLIIVRNPTTDKILKNMRQRNYIEMESIHEDKIIQAQKTLYSFLENIPTTYNCFYKVNNKDEGVVRINRLWSIQIHMINIGMKLSRHKSLWRLLSVYAIVFISISRISQKLQNYTMKPTTRK